MTDQVFPADSFKPRPIRNWSVSQVEFHLDCQRKQYFRSVLGIPQPFNASADRGTKVHSEIEHTIESKLIRDTEWKRYVEAVQEFDPNTLGAPGVAFRGSLLPAPGENAAVELNFSIPTHTGHPWQGKIDLLRDETSPVIMIDWKTTSDIRYAKVTPLELQNNLQLASYGEFLYQEGVPGGASPRGDSDALVRAGLVYIEVPKKPTKRKPRITAGFIDLDRESVRDIWEGNRTVPTEHRGPVRLPMLLDEMVINSEVKDWREIQPNRAVCGKYGGCPYRENCPERPFAGISLAGGGGSHEPAKRITIQESKEVGKMGAFDRFRTGNGKSVDTSSEAAMIIRGESIPAKAPVVTTPLATSGGSSFRKQLLDRARAQGMNVNTDVETRRTVMGEENVAARLPDIPTGVVPPDAPPRDSVDPVETTVASAETPAPKKRGHPRKNPETAAQAEAVKDGPYGGLEVQKTASDDDVPFGSSHDFESTDDPPQVTTTRKRAPAAAVATEFVLYMDCLPTKGTGSDEVVLADDWFGPLDMELNDWAQSEKNLPSWWLLDFSTQKAMLAIGVQKRIQGGLPSAMVFKSGTFMARDVLPLLIPHATRMIQAIR